MPADELPSYPTPQQASYVVQSGQPAPRRSKPPAASYKPHPHQQYAKPYQQYQPQYYQQAPPPQQYYQQAPQPPAAQYYQSQPPPQQPQQQYYQEKQYHEPPKQYHEPAPKAYHEPPKQYHEPPKQYHDPKPYQEQKYQDKQYHEKPYLEPKQEPRHEARHETRHDSRSRSKESLPEKPSKQKLEYELRSVFDKVDVSKSGKISQAELSNALLNFDHTKFQDSTITLMINLFSSSSGANKSLNFDQFVSLWKYLSAYKKLFLQADTNKSGDISFGEFQQILEQIGYKLNIDLVLHLFQKFTYKGHDFTDASAVGKLKFDKFIELLVYLRRLTDIFKKYDKDLSGVATINFSDFLLEVSNLS